MKAQIERAPKGAREDSVIPVLRVADVDKGTNSERKDKCSDKVCSSKRKNVADHKKTPFVSMIWILNGNLKMFDVSFIQNYTGMRRINQYIFHKFK